MLRIATLKDNQRMSTKELLLTIAAAAAKGERDFHIAASGQHDIGGALWTSDGETINFEISNPGQRVGGMCLPGVKIVVDGSAPADVGWLNSGGEITVKGDAGDTAGHCAAGGRIYIGGRAGTRSGALMKHDPLEEPPELWILKNAGSFSFEFMSGGRAVVCGHDCLTLSSCLGERPCVGMVGGVVYFRGEAPELPAETQLCELDEDDRRFLDAGFDRFLEAIGKPQLKRDLTIWKHWRKIIPAPERQESPAPDIKEFHRLRWFENGVFAGDPEHESFVSLVPCGDFRLRLPLWLNEKGGCTDCRQCLKNCPRHAIKRSDAEGGVTYSATDRLCIGCGACAAICPKNVWQMRNAF